MLDLTQFKLDAFRREGVSTKQQNVETSADKSCRCRPCTITIYDVCRRVQTSLLLQTICADKSADETVNFSDHILAILRRLLFFGLKLQTSAWFTSLQWHKLLTLQTSSFLQCSFHCIHDDCIVDSQMQRSDVCESVDVTFKVIANFYENS